MEYYPIGSIVLIIRVCCCSHVCNIVHVVQVKSKGPRHSNLCPLEGKPLATKGLTSF